MKTLDEDRGVPFKPSAFFGKPSVDADPIDCIGPSFESDSFPEKDAVEDSVVVQVIRPSQYYVHLVLKELLPVIVTCPLQYGVAW